MNPELNTLLRNALTCSVFVDPSDPGLTNAEMFEIGRQAGFRDGEIGDTIPHVPKGLVQGRGRFIPSHHDLAFSEIHEAADPPLLNTDAADFVIVALNERVRNDGIRSARLDRGAVVERAVAEGHDRATVEGAITCLVLGQMINQTDNVLVPRHQNGLMQLFRDQQRPAPFRPNAVRPRALALVRDVVARRTDGRPRHAEPLDAFGEALEQIGFRQFRTWWRQTVTELRGSDPNAAPVSCALLSAALVEGALTFAARHSRDHQLGAFQSNDFDGEPRNWKAERLIESAARGGAAAILTPQLRARAEHLNRTRQRVHVGRLLSENPGGVPDLRPEEGRDAKATAEQVVRAVLDWLERVSAA